MTACCLYYTAHRHPPEIEAACRAQLDRARGDIPLVAVGLQPFDYGDVTIVLGGLEPGPLTLHKQILAGLRLIGAEWVYFCENDILYHPSHFEYAPGPDDVFGYNTHIWRVRYDDGHAVWTDNLEQTSGLCGHRWRLFGHYTRRVDAIERDGFDRHYEPGPKTGLGKPANWQSRYPNLDIRHDRTMTRSKWSPSEFRNQRYAQGWREADEVDGWGPTKPIVDAIREGRYGAE
jgi:hypothetical protein